MPQPGRMKLWTVAAVVVAAALYVTALSNDVYALTSPESLSWHVLLRKAYSVVAFALVGYLAGRAFLEWRRRPTLWGLAVIVAVYSAAIEVGQALHGSREGLTWNAVDTACGGLGGWLGALCLPRPERVRERRPR